MNNLNSIKISSWIILLGFILGISCSREKPLQFKYKTIDFSRSPDTVQSYAVSLSRIRFKKIDDSTIVFISIKDSMKPWNSNSYRHERDKSNMDEYLYAKMDSIWSENEKTYSSFDEKPFYFKGINEKTRIISLSLDNEQENETLLYEMKKEYNNINIYSFYYNFKGFDGDYRVYFCDSIGIIAWYSTSWSILSILEEIKNSDKMTEKWKSIKPYFLEDTSFFPYPNSVYTTPQKIEK